MAQIESKQIHTIRATFAEVAATFDLLPPQWRAQVLSAMNLSTPFTFTTDSLSEARGIQSVLEGKIVEIIEVRSETDSTKFYTVTLDKKRGPLSCTCPSFLYQTTFCKHMEAAEAVRLRSKLNNTVTPTVIDIYGSVVNKLS